MLLYIFLLSQSTNGASHGGAARLIVWLVPIHPEGTAEPLIDAGDIYPSCYPLKLLEVDLRCVFAFFSFLRHL